MFVVCLRTGDVEESIMLPRTFFESTQIGRLQQMYVACIQIYQGFMESSRKELDKNPDLLPPDCLPHLTVL